MKNLNNLAFALLLLMSTYALAQEEPLKRNQITFSIGHTGVGQGVDAQGNKLWVNLPIWSLNYDYSLSRKWSVGWHNDIVTETFKAEGFMLGEEEVTTAVERHYPVSSLAMVSFQPRKYAVFSVGQGGSFSSTGNYWLTRLEFDLRFRISDKWDLVPGVAYDMVWNAYDSFSIALAVTRKF